MSRLGVSVVLAGLALALSAGGLGGLVRAQEATVQVLESEVVNNFPEGITFRITLDPGDTQVERVALRYQILPVGLVSTAATECSDDFIRCTAEVLRVKADLAPFMEINYFWRIEDAAGNETTTEEATLLWEDTRFDWQSRTEGLATIYWYRGSEGSLEPLLQSAGDTLERVGELLQVEVKDPVKLVLYDTAGDIQPVQEERGETFESQIITCGFQPPRSGVVVLVNECGGLGTRDTVRHELSHHVTELAFLDSAFRNALPAWLNEGLAVYSQSDAGSYEAALQRAVARDSLISIHALSSAPGDPSKVILFYGQSWSLVSYLIGTYGEEKFAELFRVIGDGFTTSDAVEQVYGFSLGQLQQEWRTSLGLPAEPPAAEPEAPAEEEEPVPTAEPASEEGPAPEPAEGPQVTVSGGEESIWREPAFLAALAVLGAAVLGMILILGLDLARRRGLGGLGGRGSA